MDIEKYKFKNNKATYYRVSKDLKVEYIEPSFIFELLYFKNEKLLEKELKKIVIEKEKKIKRLSKLDINTLEDRLFRSLVNKDKYTSISLANELYKKDKEKLLNILYKLSFLSEDENKLIKTYLFEYLIDKVGYNKYLLKNVIVYFIKSYSKYMDFDDNNQLEYFQKNVTKLYQIVYNLSSVRREKLNIKKLELESNNKMSEIKKYICLKLEGEDLLC